ncbi:beta strand repeat-containing protein [Hyalangium versicolor]|uniref:beta strand repeat-containing protein n=1 Tax=Hyalangium versicolor TaxID=2861190 RepID=UPI001CCD4F7A|nr:chitobiase/beta-hexosaminidase C-terminal domain-containing protein [Hyalangium versicolor]
MALRPAGSFRFVVALLFVQVFSACGGDPKPPPPEGDTTAPTTQAQPAGGSFTSAISVALTCTDQGGSGCSATHYTTDGSAPTQSSPRYSAPIAIAATTTLKFFSVDGAGNTESVKTEVYTFTTTPTDTTAPVVSASPVGGTYTSSQMVTLTCDDGAGSGCASVRYTTDGSAPTAASAAYSSPIAITANTTLKFIGIDNAGNTSAVSTETYVINVDNVDTAAPTVVASPVGGTYTSVQSVTLTCDDGSGSGCASIRYTTDGSTPTASSAAYAAPISISANTTLKFIGIDNAGNTSAVRTETYVININVDTAAPTVAANPVGGTYTSVQSVTLTCDDGSGSGCASIRYTTDGSTPTASSAAYAAPISITANTTLKFIGIDNAGNTSAVRTETYVINVDTAAPMVAASPTGGTYTSTLNVILTCDDGSGSGCASIRYTTDGSTPTASSAAYAAPIAITANTTLKFIGIDNAGNTSAVRTETYVINLDTAAPSVAASPVGGTYNSVQTVDLSCDDGSGSGCASIRYTTDGSTPTASSLVYSGPIFITVNTTLKFIGIDNAGNISAVSTETYVITIDATPPTVVASPAGGTYNSAQSVTLTCDDGSGSGCFSIRYTTDGSTPTASSLTYSSPIAITANTTLKFIANDNANNTSAVSTETYVIDMAAPSVTASPSGGTYNSAQSVTLTCADGSGSGCSSIHYTTDGSSPTASSPTYSAPIAITANTTLKFVASDNAGNTSAVGTETYVIDTAAPTVTASPAGGTYTSAQSVTLTCNDGSGSGCASIYYTTDGSTPTVSSAVYSAPISITANTTLKFIGIDNAGNTSAVRTETYVVDTVAPTVTASPAGGAYPSSRSVTLTCDDGSGTGCLWIRYTTDGSTPTASSTLYSTPITIATSRSLKFIGRDNAGNTSAVRTETYVIDSGAPTTSASPVGGLYSTAQTVTLSCSDGSGSGCAATYYTVDGSTPSTGSSVYTAPLTISANTLLKFFSVDLVGNAEAVKSQQYFIGTTPASTSVQIGAVRSATNGTVNLPIAAALVTYVKPAVGSDAAGFFLQAEQPGPAVFIAVDPSTLTPVPTAGDRVSLTATQKTTVSSMVHVTAISGYSRSGSGESVSPLSADVSTVDVPASLANYESELISISGTLSTAFSSPSAGYVASSLTTVGTPSGTNLQLRLPTLLQDQLDVAKDCSVTANAPLWRTSAVAQASGWKLEDITVLACPAPKVVSAVARSATSVAVQFDRRIAPASVQANGSQFTFSGGLSASAASVQDREVVVTTGTQTSSQSYTVTVNTSVTDTLGTAVSSTANTATFTGYVSPATLRISEVAPNISSSRDLVELFVVQGGTVANFTILQDQTVFATLPSVVVATGDVIVVHFTPDTGVTDAPGSETTSKNQYPAGTYANNYDNAWDFHGTANNITYSARILRVKNAQGVTQDGVSFSRTSGSLPATFFTELQSLQAEGQWLPADCNGSPCSTNAAATAISAVWEGVGNSRTTPTVRRVSATDTNMAADWAVGASSLGVANP